MQTIDAEAADKIRQDLLNYAEADAVHAVRFGLQRASEQLTELRSNLRSTTELNEGLQTLIRDVSDVLADVRALELLRIARRNMR